MAWDLMEKEATTQVVLVADDRLRSVHPAAFDRIRTDDVETSAQEDQLGDRLPHGAFQLLYHAPQERIGAVGGILCSVQCVVLLLPVFTTERALKKHFTDDGIPRS